jgi:hypothetical protein
MRLFAILATAGAIGVGGTIAGGGVQVRAPAGWHRIAPAPDKAVTEPQTLLVAGTAGVQARRTQCQIAAYRVPAAGAVVVIVAWKMAHGQTGPGLSALAKLTAVHRPSFECFKGRGAATQLVLRERIYQVNVMVGDRASQQRIAEALAVARSFRLKQ